MLSLSDAQGNFIDTINEGPDRLDALLFAGSNDRVLLGLKAHANTINHARLVALEETFPLTRQEIGEAPFNLLSRDYVETADARAADSNHLGQNFAVFLQEQLLDPAIVELAAIEWAWLESYHAADAVALSVTELAGLDEEALLNMTLVLHPSARVVSTTAPLAAAIVELAGTRPHAIMTLRPEAEVRLVPLDPLQSMLVLHAKQENCTLGNLLAVVIEHTDEQALLEPILSLISAGALVKAG